MPEEPYSKIQAHPLISQLLSAGVSGIFSEFISYPFFTIWVRQHARSQTFFQASRDIFRQGKQFYLGFSMAAITTVPGSAAYLYGLHTAKYYCGESYWGCCAQALYAQFLSMIVCEPSIKIMEGIQVRQSIGKEKISARLYAKNILKKEGILGFYHGLLPGFFSYVLLDSFGLYFQTKILSLLPDNHQKRFTAQLMSYMIAFSLASVVTAPVDVLALHLRTKNTHLKDFTPFSFHHFRNSAFRRGLFHALPAAILHSALYYTLIPCAEVGEAKLCN